MKYIYTFANVCFRHYVLIGKKTSCKFLLIFMKFWQSSWCVTNVILRLCLLVRYKKKSTFISYIWKNVKKCFFFNFCSRYCFLLWSKTSFCRNFLNFRKVWQIYLCLNKLWPQTEPIRWHLILQKCSLRLNLLDLNRLGNC